MADDRPRRSEEAFAFLADMHMTGTGLVFAVTYDADADEYVVLRLTNETPGVADVSEVSRDADAPTAVFAAHALWEANR